jgi:hypothetical protein
MKKKNSKPISVKGPVRVRLASIPGNFTGLSHGHSILVFAV